MAETNNELVLRQMEYEMTPAGQQQRQIDNLARQSDMYAKSTIIPDTYKNNPGNCGIAIDMAQRMGCNPLMVMQNLYIIHGQPSFSTKFLIAALNTTGHFSALDYEWRGTEGKEDWGCRACAIRLSDGKKLEGTWITIKMAKAEGWTNKAGSKWNTMPQQMLMYRAAAFFQRTYAPEVSMGFISSEEASEMDVPETIDTTYKDVTPKKDARSVLEQAREKIANANAATATTENETEADNSGLTTEEKLAIMQQELGFEKEE